MKRKLIETFVVGAAMLALFTAVAVIGGLKPVDAQTASSMIIGSSGGATTGSAAASEWSTSATLMLGSGSALTGALCANASGMVFNCNEPPKKRIGPPIMLAAVRASAKPIRERIAPAAYLELAKLIRLESAATDEIRMTEAIRAQSLTVYEEQLVGEYLTDKAQAISVWTRWVWKPLRETDLASIRKSERLSQPSGSIVALSLYPHAVPAVTLNKVKAMLEELPEAVFFVSDYETVKPDPFLAVTTRRLLEAGKVWIIDQWDEPGFGVPDTKTYQRSIL